MNKRVFIVGGGPSLIGFDFNKLINEDTIAINRSVFDLPRAKYFLTMDYTFLSRMRLQGARVNHKRLVDFVSNPSEKMFVVGFDDRRFEKRSDVEILDKFTGMVYDLHLFNKVIWASARGGIGMSMEDFRSSSDSGFSAIQLATLLGYNEIYLLGMDFLVSESGTHYHKDYGSDKMNYQDRLDWFYTEYGRAFSEIREKLNIKVFSCSRISKLNGLIPFANIEEVL